MKKILASGVFALSCLATFSAHSSDVQVSDFRADKEFVASCPVQFLTYIDQAEGGPGAYCACPDENLTYIDKSEGGPGVFCADDKSN